MHYIDEKFKDCSPEETVKKIKGILDSLGIKVEEHWSDSGIENCHSLQVCTKKGIPTTNGKGITKEFARASAYAEFIERLQSGLYLTKYQSIMRDPELNFHLYAPDGKYMTVDELIENGEWMDYIVNEYKSPLITRETIAENARAYACADDGKILTVPFYSLFEDKYVYLPIAFVGRMYTANGNCAGNTKEEAWVHALSEIMERNASQKMVMSGKAYPKIPEETLQKFPTVSKILKKIRENDDYDITIFDCSIGNGFPVISTRVINKTTQSYLVNVAADPVLEIAIQRTLTELFQGRSINNLNAIHTSKILNKITDFPIASNVLNHTQTSDGMYTADYFANEITCQRKATNFADNSNKTNKELLKYILDLYKEMGKPVYIRNYSFLGFQSYKFVVPGFSETRSVCLNDMIPEYDLADSVREAFKNPSAVSNEDLIWLINYSEIIKPTYKMYNTFGTNAGIPLSGTNIFPLTYLTRAYAAYRLGNYKQALDFVKPYLKKDNTHDQQYLRCVNMYLKLKIDGIDDDKIREILYKFFKNAYPDSLYKKIDNGHTPYDDYITHCDLKNCSHCKYLKNCSYQELKYITKKVGSVYKTFKDGQNASNFVF